MFVVCYMYSLVLPKIFDFLITIIECRHPQICDPHLKLKPVYK